VVDRVADLSRLPPHEDRLKVVRGFVPDRLMMAQREIVERCLVDVIRAVGKHDLTKLDELLVGAIFTSAAIYSTLEAGSANGTIEEDRARVRHTLSRLNDLVEGWVEGKKQDVADDLFQCVADSANPTPS
jgi:hypothetical protein